MKKLIVLSGIFCMLFFCSCLEYGKNVMQSSVSLSSDSCNADAKNIFLFLAGEPINFAYQKKCIIEVVGSEYSTDQELLNRLKNQAFKNCANSIINIRTYTVVREYGTTGDDKCHKKTYYAKVYNGIGISIKSWGENKKKDSFG